MGHSQSAGEAMRCAIACLLLLLLVSSADGVEEEMVLVGWVKERKRKRHVDVRRQRCRSALGSGEDAC